MVKEVKGYKCEQCGSVFEIATRAYECEKDCKEFYRLYLKRTGKEEM